MNSQIACFLNETDAHMGEMAIEKENYWPFCKEVIDTGIKLPLKPSLPFSKTRSLTL